jgi:hypothetical protein
VGGKSFKSKKKRKKRKLGGGRAENEVPKKKLRSRLRKGQRKKVNMGWHMDRKENPIGAPSIHIGALMGAGSF